MNNNGNCEFGLSLSKRVDAMAAALAEVDKKASLTEKILERLEDSNNKLVDTISDFSNTMKQIEITMVSMQNQIVNNTEDTKVIKGEIATIKTEIKKQEEKSKIDWQEVVKSVLTSKLTWLIGGGLIALAINLSAQQSGVDILQFLK